MQCIIVYGFCPSAIKCMYNAIIRAIRYGFYLSRHAWKWFCLLDKREKRKTSTTTTKTATYKLMWLRQSELYHTKKKRATTAIRALLNIDETCIILSNYHNSHCVYRLIFFFFVFSCTVIYWPVS